MYIKKKSILTESNNLQTKNPKPTMGLLAFLSSEPVKWSLRLMKQGFPEFYNEAVLQTTWRTSNSLKLHQ